MARRRVRCVPACWPHVRRRWSARAALVRWAGRQGLTARGFHRAWRVARTLADLDGGGAIQERDVMEALGYRLVEHAA